MALAGVAGDFLDRENGGQFSVPDRFDDFALAAVQVLVAAVLQELHLLAVGLDFLFALLDGFEQSL